MKVYIIRKELHKIIREICKRTIIGYSPIDIIDEKRTTKEAIRKIMKLFKDKNV